MGVPNCQLTTNFSANCQLTTVNMLPGHATGQVKLTK